MAIVLAVCIAVQYSQAILRTPVVASSLSDPPPSDQWNDLQVSTWRTDLASKLTQKRNIISAHMTHMVTWLSHDHHITLTWWSHDCHNPLATTIIVSGNTRVTIHLGFEDVAIVPTAHGTGCLFFCRYEFPDEADNENGQRKVIS